MIQLLSIEEIKKHLNIEEWYKDDDNYLLSLYNFSLEAVSIAIDTDIQKLVQSGKEINPLIKQATLLLIGNWYENRSNISYGNGNPKDIPNTLNWVFNLIKNYNIEFCKKIN